MDNKISKAEHDCKEFLIENKVNFEQMIRCANFWNYHLHQNEKEELVKLYTQGDFCGYGWY